MRKVFLLFGFFVFFSTLTFSQVLLNENFDYGSTPNTDLTAASTNWARYSGTTGPTYVFPGLTYEGYPSSGVGGAVGMAGSSSGDARIALSSVVSTTSKLYLSFLVNITAANATADYFLHFSRSNTSSTIYRARPYIIANGSGYSVQFAKSTETKLESSTILEFGKTYLFVITYTLNLPGLDDDVTSLYIYDNGIPAAEPGTPLVALGPVGAGVSNDPPDDLGFVALRQGSNGMTGTVDGIRVAKSWSDLFPPSPAVGDYGTAGDGDYDVTGTWVVCATAGSWTDATAATSGPDSTKNVWIRSGHNINYKTSGKFCRNLVVENGAALKGDIALPTSSIRYLRVVGTSAIIDGTLGDDAPGNNVSLEFYHDLTITGSGKINPARIRPGSKITNATLTIDCDMNLMYSGSSGTGGAAIYTGNSANDNITVTLNLGRTLTFVDYAYLGTSSSTSSDGTASTIFNINGTLIQEGVSASTTLRVAAGKTCALNIGTSGSMSVSKNFNASLGAGTTTITNDGVLNLGTGGNGTIDFSDPNIYIGGTGTTNVKSGSTLKIGAPSGLEPVAGPIRTASKNFEENCKFDYVGTAAQETGADLPSSVYRLIIENTAGVTLSAPVTVTDTASIASTASLIESDTKYVTGAIKTTQTVGVNASTLGGIGVELNAGSDDLGDVTVVRTSASAANSIKIKTIKRNWDILSANPPTAGRDLTFKWAAGDDNDLTLTNAVVFKSTDSGSNWTKATTTGVDVSATHTITVAGVNSFSLWTVGEVATSPYHVTIAEARKDANNDLIPDYSISKDTLRIAGIITSPLLSKTNATYFVQDATGGIEIYYYGALPSTALAIGDSVFVVGIVAQYHGLTEIVPLSLDQTNFGILKHNATVPEPLNLTLQEFAANAESYEGMLVKVDTLYKTSGTWPAASKGASIYMTDKTNSDTIQVYISSYTNIGGTKEPEYPVAVTGIASQYSSGTTVDNGYEIMPMDSTNIKHVVIVGIEDNPGLNFDYSLSQNYPNPFNPSTTIKYTINKDTRVKILIYNVLGQVVATLVDKEQSAGNYTLNFDAGKLSSGIYFYTINAGSFVQTKKMMLLK